MFTDFTKRTFDIAMSIGGLLVMSPALAVIALAVKLTSSGPIVYRGLRTGRGGKPFYILKFRSMVPGAEGLGGSTTGKNDPRVTPIGSLLRKLKLDELPQLVNVLKGEMSFVGPRPEVPEYTDKYTTEESRILSVRPGITDFASLEFNDLQEVVGAADPDEYFRQNVLAKKNQLRLKYVDQQSMGTDTKILLRTLAVVAGKPFRRAA